MGAGVEPRGTPCKPGNMQLSTFKIRSVDIGDLELAASRRAKTGGDLHHTIVVKVESRDRVAGFRDRRLLLDRDRIAAFIQFDDPIALRITYCVGKDRCEIGRASCRERG